MNESSPSMQPRSVGSSRSLDNIDMNGNLVMVWDSAPVDIEKERDKLNRAVTSESLVKRANSEFEQLTIYQ
jgi:hypothetical protein